MSMSIREMPSCAQPSRSLRLSELEPKKARNVAQTNLNREVNMQFNEADVDFGRLTGELFEELCYDPASRIAVAGAFSLARDSPRKRAGGT